jgi:pimeloyl-ACP methyl ester carboxylesterase
LPVSSADIQPFTIEVTDEEIEDLGERLRRTRWPEPATVDDWTQGLPLAFAREVCAYWADEYDWRRCEAGLNSHPNFLTELGGLDVHFQHIRSLHHDATPLIVTHGWPGSIVEFQKVIGPLTDPTAHGGEASDAFHLVLPSLPGFGWSAKPTHAGTGVEAIAGMWDELMGRLGYDRYVAQGGDWGSIVTTEIGIQNQGHCRAIHVNMPRANPVPAEGRELDPDEARAYEALDYYLKTDSGYSKIQSTRPQSIGYSLVDSPVGLATWILEKFWSWTDRDGHPEDHFTRDELLDNVSVFWFTASGASSARLYWESFGSRTPGTVTIPTGVSQFPNEIVRAARRWADERFVDIRYWNEVARGGHFAAFEVPELFVSEVRAAFRALL